MKTGWQSELTESWALMGKATTICLGLSLGLKLPETVNPNKSFLLQIVSIGYCGHSDEKVTNIFVYFLIL